MGPGGPASGIGGLGERPELEATPRSLGRRFFRRGRATVDTELVTEAGAEIAAANRALARQPHRGRLRLLARYCEVRAISRTLLPSTRLLS